MSINPTFNWLTALGSGFAAIICLILGVYVLWCNHKALSNWFQFLFCMSVCGWLSFFHMMYRSETGAVALQWARGGFYAVAFIAPFMLNVICTLRKGRINWRALGIIYAIAAVLCYQNFRGVIYTEVQKFYWGYYPQATAWYWLFISQYAAVWVYCIRLLTRWMKEVELKGDFRSFRKIQYFRYACAGGLVGMVDFIAKSGIPFPPVAWLVAMYWVLLLTLMVAAPAERLPSAFGRIDGMIRKAVFSFVHQALISSTLLVLVASAVFIIYIRSAQSAQSSTFEFLKYFIGCIVGGILGQPLYQLFAKLWDRADLFKLKAAENWRQDRIFNFLPGRSPDDIYRLSLKGIVSRFGAARAWLLLPTKDRSKYELRCTEGRWKTSTQEDAFKPLSLRDRVVQETEIHGTACIVDDVKTKSESQSGYNGVGLLAKHFGEVMAVAARDSESLKGILLIGPKVSGFRYGREDRESLKTLATIVWLAGECQRLFVEWQRSQATMTVVHTLRRPLEDIKSYVDSVSALPSLPANLVERTRALKISLKQAEIFNEIDISANDAMANTTDLPFCSAEDVITLLQTVGYDPAGLAKSYNGHFPDVFKIIDPIRDRPIVVNFNAKSTYQAPAGPLALIIVELIDNASEYLNQSNGLLNGAAVEVTLAASAISVANSIAAGDKERVAHRVEAAFNNYGRGLHRVRRWAGAIRFEVELRFAKHDRIEFSLHPQNT